MGELMFHKEQLQMATDWNPLTEWFKRRAAAAGHSVYEHKEDITEYIKNGIDKELLDAAAEIAYNAGRSIADAFKTANTTEE